MAITVIEFITFATRTKRFIDAVNLVNANVGAFVVSAIEVVKSKLKGSATNIITKRNETTLKAITDKLKENIKSESSKLITSMTHYKS